MRASMTDEFYGLAAMEKAGFGATLTRCRALEHFVDKSSLADVHASLERVADVLDKVDGQSTTHLLPW